MHNQQPSGHRLRSPSVLQAINLSKTAEILLQGFQQAQQRRKLNILRSKVKGYYGKNNPIDYKQQFDFKQKWEIANSDQNEDQILFEQFHPIAKIMNVLLMIANTLTIWLLTTKRYFDVNTLDEPSVLLIIALFLQAFEMVRKYLTIKQRYESGISFKNLFRLLYFQVVCFGYILYILIANLSHHPLEHLFEFFIDYLLWTKAATIYRRLRLTQLVLRYQNHLKIFDLLLNIFIQAHIFAIFLYQASKVDPNSSWTNAISAQAKVGSMDHYIYSAYFATTTMLTIGYGDLSPKNPSQVVVVTLVQIIGVISFGYFLNQMGHTFSKMRKQRQSLQKDISSISYMAKFYNLQKHLMNRAKNYLISNQKSSQQVKPQDENKLLMKLNNQLRTEIVRQNSLNVIKSSAFLLCQWSKGFMQLIANNLEKRLVAPNQLLDTLQINLYIIKKGDVEVIMNRQGSSRNRKVMKNISIDPKIQVTDNVYGYTRMFSNRLPRLQAYARSFVATYFISKDKFRQCAQANMKDLQYFHQIKCRIDQAPFCEQWQTPVILSTRQHYNPSRYYLIKRYNGSLDKAKNKRSVHIRRWNQMRAGLVVALNIVNANGIEDLREETIQVEFDKPKIAQSMKRLQSLNWVKSKRSIQQIEEQQDSSSDPSSEPVDFNMFQSMTGALEYIRYRTKTQGFQQRDNKKQMSTCFQVNTSYTNFFPKHNIDVVLAKMQRVNCFELKIA